MTQEMTAVMEISAELMARNQFRANVLDVVVDLGLMTRWVIDRQFPLPEVDAFIPGCWTVNVWADEAFDRLADALSFDGPVEFERHAKYRTATRRFGGVSVQVVQSLGVQA